MSIEYKQRFNCSSFSFQNCRILRTAPGKALFAASCAIAVDWYRNNGVIETDHVVEKISNYENIWINHFGSSMYVMQETERLLECLQCGKQIVSNSVFPCRVGGLTGNKNSSSFIEMKSRLLVSFLGNVTIHNPQAKLFWPRLIKDMIQIRISSLSVRWAATLA